MCIHSFPKALVISSLPQDFPTFAVFLRVTYLLCELVLLWRGMDEYEDENLNMGSCLALKNARTGLHATILFLHFVICLLFFVL